jgi:hypothetical protein
MVVGPYMKVPYAVYILTAIKDRSPRKPYTLPTMVIHSFFVYPGSYTYGISGSSFET